METTDSVVLELHHSNGDYRFLTGTLLFGSKEITLLEELLMSWVFCIFSQLIISSHYGDPNCDGIWLEGSDSK